MKTTILTLAAIAGSTAAFTTQITPSQRGAALFGGAQGGATTMEGKVKRVESIKSLLDTSEIVFSIPAEYITVSEVQGLRRDLPEGTTCSVIKNKLMERATAGTPYEEGVSGLLKGSNMWFFVEDDLGGTVKSFNAFTKSSDKKETHAILGGVVEGDYYDSAGIIQVSKLPSKIELITKIAAGINAVPTKVARVIKAPSVKLARAVKLATMPEGDSE